MSRNEYPRPDFRREEYLLLNGDWQFGWDEEGTGLDGVWMFPGRTLPLTIRVPFCFESSLSGIGDPSLHRAVCYKRLFSVPVRWRERRTLLHFEAVNYDCTIFINGQIAGRHSGGFTGFSLDITRWLVEGENDLSVWVCTPFDRQDIPRGKQFWESKPRGVWYTRNSGIWQSVWLEPVSSQYIESIRFTPDVDRGTVLMEGKLSKAAEGTELAVAISYAGNALVSARLALRGQTCRAEWDVFQGDCLREGVLNSSLCWSPEKPRLLDVTLSLYAYGEEQDRVTTYIGMRKIHAKDGRVYLNNLPIYLTLVLDQGYWPDGLMTAPEDEDFRQDILLAKAMGFNGCRMHQKIEDRRFLYWADKLGFLVWEELPACWEFSECARESTHRELLEAIRRDYNHPSIIAWVPLNESWGVPAIRNCKKQQAHCLSLYYAAKAEDNTRLVVGNDGWEQTETDLCTLHQYYRGANDEETAYLRYSEYIRNTQALLSPGYSEFPPFAEGFSYQGQPILITEFGGIACRTATSDREGWGYTETDTPQQLLHLYGMAIRPILDSPHIAGFCYTQLTDVQQEQNGLLTESREYKCPPEKIAVIHQF